MPQSFQRSRSSLRTTGVQADGPSGTLALADATVVTGRSGMRPLILPETSCGMSCGSKLYAMLLKLADNSLGSWFGLGRPA